jgi:hypothetical protein
VTRIFTYASPDFCEDARMLERLRVVAPSPGTGLIQVDWSSVEQRMGHQLPADYMAICETYGPGTFDDFLHVFQPETAHEPIDLLHQRERTLWALTYLQERGEVMPYPLSGLLPAGRTDNGDVLYWLKQPADLPDKWQIVVNEARGPEWVLYRGGLVDFLADVLSGAFRCAVFPDDFPSAKPMFRPYE